MKNKGNDGRGDIPLRDLWETKQELFNLLNEQYKFNFDCCASENNKKCALYSNDFEKLNNIKGVCWINPPFSNSLNMFKHFFKVVKKGVGIYRCDNMETKIYQEIIFNNASWVFIPKGRISYTPFEVGAMRNGNGTRFPSALIGIGLPPPPKIKRQNLIY